MYLCLSLSLSLSISSTLALSLSLALYLSLSRFLSLSVSLSLSLERSRLLSPSVSVNSHSITTSPCEASQACQIYSDLFNRTAVAARPAYWLKNYGLACYELLGMTGDSKYAACAREHWTAYINRYPPHYAFQTTFDTRIYYGYTGYIHCVWQLLIDVAAISTTTRNPPLKVSLANCPRSCTG